MFVRLNNKLFKLFIIFEFKGVFTISENYIILFYFSLIKVSIVN
jgi:hypothetical protein